MAKKAKNMVYLGGVKRYNPETKDYGMIYVYVDPVKLADVLGWKACRNLSGKAMLQGGSVEVRTTKRSRGVINP